MNRRVLVITHWYYPRNNPRSFRARALVDELNKQDIECDVYIGEKSRRITCKELSSYYNCSTDSSRSGKTVKESYIKSIIRNIMHYMIGEKFIITNASRTIRQLKKYKYDAIISIGNPFYSHVIAVVLKNKKIVNKVIADCGDPFYLGMHRHSIFVKIIQKRVFSSIDYLTIPIKGAVDYYGDYITNDRIRIIPQGFSREGIKIKHYIFLSLYQK